MNSSMVDLNPELQALVDERLDAIERVLLSTGVSRGERGGIVGEVETQIFELLARRTSGEPTRDDVLAVLSQLDPPESYAPEGFTMRSGAAAPAPRQPRTSALAVGSAATGTFFALAGMFNLLASQDEALLLFEAFVILASSIGGAISLRRIQRSRGWLYGRTTALCATTLFPLFLANAIAAAILLSWDELLLLIGFAITFLGLNAGLIYGAWRLGNAWFPQRDEPLAAVR
ncbi:MAG: hypothetical protein AB7U73_04035 [Pirellulales bacterium]